MSYKRLPVSGEEDKDLCAPEIGISQIPQPGDRGPSLMTSLDGKYLQLSGWGASTRRHFCYTVSIIQAPCKKDLA